MLIMMMIVMMIDDVSDYIEKRDPPEMMIITAALDEIASVSGHTGGNATRALTSSYSLA